MKRIRAQLRPADTNTATLYQVGTKAAPATGQGPIGEGRLSIVYTGAGTSATARVFVQHKGADNDEGTTILWDDQIPLGKPSDPLDIPALQEDGDSVGVRSSAPNDLTFTLVAD